MAKSIRSKRRRKNKRVRAECLALQGDKDLNKIVSRLDKDIRAQTINKRELEDSAKSLYAPSEKKVEVIVDVMEYDDEKEDTPVADVLKVKPAISREKTRKRTEKRKQTRALK
eukprot:CAMPEP_0201478336 /NCGR_PEP_ID=MMETSP0151_2-20130828/3214_1 /ASSEMBLY_ACC=CAM_ASM_000257 /TAXON_ID=200890 /ORGANISM="Paramoeba atlantica, Strain 621/1 / CCAP 1560/9" /LENGTH=112 /DNA_ID=CAMNT_0047859393 /DNA_START=47 /DNA_END=385 /DNA_ORIENTATION=-